MSGPNTGKYGPEITPYLDTFHTASLKNKACLQQISGVVVILPYRMVILSYWMVILSYRICYLTFYRENILNKQNLNTSRREAFQAM